MGFSDLQTLDDYLQAHGSMLGRKAVSSLEPLHVPGRDPLLDMSMFLRQPFEPQAHVITAGVKVLNRQKAFFCVGECGTGKTLLAQCIAHKHARGKPYRALVMAPDHLIGKWVREIEETIPGASVRRFGSWKEVLDLLAKRSSRPGKWQKPLGPEWFILGRNQSKWDPDFQGHGEGKTGKLAFKTVVVGREPVLDEQGEPVLDGKGRPRFQVVTDRVACCPKCGQVIKNKNGVPMVEKDLGAKQLTCKGTYLQGLHDPDKRETGLDRICPVPERYGDASVGRVIQIEDRRYAVRECGEALWSWTPKPYRWAPAKLIHKKLNKLFRYVLIDEVHESKSDESAQSMAAGKLMAAGGKVIALTGTLIGGYAHHLFPLTLRMSPKTLRDEGHKWGQELPFAQMYGRIDTIITSKAGSDEGASKRRGSTSMAKPRTSKRRSIRPGVMPTLFGRHLIGNAIFLGLDEMAEELPDLHDETIPVPMDPELAQGYAYVECVLSAAVKNLLRSGSMKLLGAMLHTLLDYPDRPYGWEPEHEDTLAIGYYAEPDDYSRENWVGVVQPPNLESAIVRPKETKLIELCQAERAEGRQVWVFCQMTGKRDIQPRLARLLEREGLRVNILRSGTVDPKEREDWIAQNGRDADVILSHPKLVSTGLDLFSKTQGGHNFATIVFYETGYDLFTLRQAARRAWRIGQPLDCRVYYLYYQGTMQERAMSLMGKKMSAATALEGKFSTEGLVAMAGEDNAQMALARSLSEKIEDAQRAWGKVTGSRSILRPTIPFGSLSLPPRVLIAAVLDTEADGEVGTIPMLARDELAAMLLSLKEAGISLDF